MATFTIPEEIEIIHLSRERDANGQLPSNTSVADAFNRVHGRTIRGRDVERLINRLETNGVCRARHQAPRRNPEVVSPEIRQRVHDHFMIADNRNDSLRVAARQLGMHYTTVYR